MVDRVTEYAQAVVNGQEIAGNYVLMACKRHLEDIEKSKLAPYKYEFNIDKAIENIEFFETLRFTDGEIRGQQVVLFDFQCFIVGSLFGWQEKGTGRRRFKKSYIQLARKNAKSLLNSGIGIKLARFDGYANAQIYCTATKMRQARIVWEQAKKFIEIEPDLKELFKIKDHDAVLLAHDTGGKIMALGRDVGTIDGFDPHGGIIDEYHGHKTNQMLKLLEDGAVNQKESLISIITTAGFDLNGPCYAEYEYCIKVLEGIIDNDEYFIYIAQMDADDDIWNETNWIKCNPLVAKLPQGLENLKRFAAEAREKGGEDLKNFMTKSLNIWVQFADNQYINVENWKNCGSCRTLEDFKNQSCFVGLDLSSGGDLTSLALIFIYYKDNEKKYYIYSHSFMPAARVAEHIKTDKVPYDIYINNGLLTVTETLSGVKTDYKYIIKHLRELKEKYNLRFIEIGYDPHNAAAFLADVEEFGVDSCAIVQSCRSLNDPTVDFKLEVDAGNIEYNQDNKLLTWSVVNARTTRNSFGEIKIDKQSAYARIDPIDAIIDGYKLAFTDAGINTAELTNDYLDLLGW